MKPVRTFFLFLISFILIIVSVVNRQEVVVSLWPFPYESQMPLFVVFFIGIFVGLVLASFYLAIRNARHAAEMRQARKEKEKLAGDVDTLERELDKKPPKIESKDYSEQGPGDTKAVAKSVKKT